VTYSQSTDPASPHYNDFTKQYSQKAWKRLPFRAADVKAAKVSEVRLKN
jgi:acyl-homoserine-lactone acylase